MDKMNKNENKMKSSDKRELEEKQVLESRDPAELLMTNIEDAKKMMNAKQDAKLTNLDKKRIVNDTMGEMK
ncbi:hypothetical protein [Metaclostridioides mangenotii]|uniref:Uncharacterized protein n=1 Tax=Metaclostridioides mangenotii TaxID=1540 RepID=A0ABS4E7I3_9FIRM|nr:hypothetical protein [Clostridioides mangenotii]MBP1853908.1 hypothetical protein [Clostridioides mangenotii]